ncbi:MAG: rhamnogalacturonan acetylesterase [Limisphaerales bacterium]
MNAAQDERPVVGATSAPLERVARSALPTLYIIGDSTVRGSGSGHGIVGWGERIAPYFDTNKINVVNDAIAGRSARTFFTEGRWAKVRRSIKPGDFLMIQFGHNDQGRIGDPANKHRADGRGIGPETVDDVMPDGSKVAVHTFGWYMARFATGAKSRGASVIICSPIPHKQRWQKGRDFADIAHWDSQVARANGAYFVDLTMAVSAAYKRIGMEKVATLFADKGTHTTSEGAQFNARCVIAGVKGLANNPLAGFLSPKGQEVQPYSPSK